MRARASLRSNSRLGDLLGSDVLPLGAALAHHLEPDSSVGHLGGEVEVEEAGGQVIEVHGKGGPLPGEILVKRGARDLPDLLHQFDQPLAVGGVARGEPDATSAPSRPWSHPAATTA